MLGTKPTSRWIHTATLLLLLGSVSGCYYTDDGSYPVDDGCGACAVAPELVSLNLSPANVVVWPGDEVQYVVTGEYSDGTVLDLTSEAIWSSSDSWVAGVSNSYGRWGYATAYDDGPTTITASLPEGDIFTDLYVDSTAPVSGKGAPRKSTTVQIKKAAERASR